MDQNKATIITIGDELLIGQVIDTNSAFIAQSLNAIGVVVTSRIAVGDDKLAISNALDNAIEHNNIIIHTGGLGPTSDYITKPFELSELLARVQAFSRRLNDAAHANQPIDFGDLQVNVEQAWVTWSGKIVELTKKEWLLLRVLLESPQRVFTREQLANALYCWGDEADSNTIDVNVHHIRRKTASKIIKTMRGLGYRLGLDQ